MQAKTKKNQDKSEPPYITDNRYNRNITDNRYNQDHHTMYDFDTLAASRRARAELRTLSPNTQRQNPRPHDVIGGKLTNPILIIVCVKFFLVLSVERHSIVSVSYAKYIPDFLFAKRSVLAENFDRIIQTNIHAPTLRVDVV